MLFYPSHDIALAHGVRHFNPPVAALRLQEDLASLADVWNQPFIAGKVPFPQPWGWDWDTRQLLLKKYRVKASQLPTDEELESIRQLSSRQTTVTLIQQLNQATGAHYALPSYLQEMEQVAAYIHEHNSALQPFVLKTPWSSSGRGLMRSTLPTDSLLRHAQATLQRMGGIMAEEWIEHKVQDFAMLFFVSDSEVKFLGYSLFDNDGTTYRQGYLMSNESIVQRLQIDPQMLDDISRAYVMILTQLFRPFFNKPWQLGYVGIDMMTYGEGSLNIHPCVEMNLRCTMGVVCRLWYEQHQQEGIFRISAMDSTGHFHAEFDTQM